MKRALLIYLFLQISLQLDCNPDTQLLYQNLCIAKTCLTDTLSRIQMKVVDKNDAGTENEGISYDVGMWAVDPGTFHYRVLIQYSDEENNQIVKDPVNCVDWRVFQTRNAYNIDSTRIQRGESEWAVPQVTYTYNKETKKAELEFSLTQNEEDTKDCIKFQNGDINQVECFFELAFVLQEVTQMSYYLSFSSQFITNQFPLKVDFLPLVPKGSCQPEDTVICKTQSKIDSSLWFCKTSSCDEIQNHPFVQIYVDQEVYMMHRIDDPNYQNDWEFNQLVINIQGYQSQSTIQQDQLDSLSQSPGQIIFSVKITSEQQNMLISSFGYLQYVGKAEKAPLTETKVEFVLQTLETGSIIKQDLVNETLGQNEQTVPETCLKDTLPRIQMKVVERNDAGETINEGISYDLGLWSVEPGTFHYNVIIQYPDEENNEIVKDPVNCINWRVYQTKNSYNIDPTRILRGESEWAVPHAEYTFNADTKKAEINFSLNQNEEDTKDCIRFQKGDLNQVDCFFELAFVIKEVTYMSYYLGFHSEVEANSNLLKLDPFPLIPKVACHPGQTSSCITEIKIDSSLLFCKTATCEQIQNEPFSQIYFEDDIYMTQIIKDVKYQVNWTINELVVSLQGYQLQSTIEQSQLAQLAQSPGQIIFSIKINQEQEKMLISTFGKLKYIGTNEQAAETWIGFVQQTVEIGSIIKKDEPQLLTEEEASEELNEQQDETISLQDQQQGEEEIQSEEVGQGGRQDALDGQQNLPLVQYMQYSLLLLGNLQ